MLHPLGQSSVGETIAVRTASCYVADGLVEVGQLMVTYKAPAAWMIVRCVVKVT